MIWIDRQEAFDRMIDRVAAERVVGVDTEADSLHSYFDKVCLIQISVPGDDFVIDPLARIDLARFGQLLANPAVTKILHGADYDLRILQRDFGFLTTNLVDTMICAQLLGYEAFGLAALLDRHFGVKLEKAHQRADWAMRPLSPDMLSYAARDTHYLAALADILRADLERLGRWEWALEEFSRLEGIRYRENDDPEPWRKLKNLGTLDRRSLAIVRDLHAWRDRLARKADRPPFRIIGNDAMVEIARAKPASHGALEKVKGVARYHLDRYGREIVRIVTHALEIPEEALPEKNQPRAWVRDRALDARIERLRSARDAVAKELKIDPAVLAPRHVLTAIATIVPDDVRQLDEVPAMREWQKRVLGPALIGSLKKQ